MRYRSCRGKIPLLSCPECLSASSSAAASGFAILFPVQATVMPDSQKEENRDEQRPSQSLPPSPSGPLSQAGEAGCQSPPEPADPALAAGRRSVCVACWTARIALILYLVLLFWLAWGERSHQSALHLEDLLRLGHWVARAFRTVMVAVAQFMLLGLLAAMAIGRFSSPVGRRETWGRWLGIVLAGGVVAVLFAATMPDRSRGAAWAVVAVPGIMLGAWIGIACQQGRQAVLRLLRHLGALLLALCGMTTVLFFLATDDEPLPFEPPKVSSAEKRRLADLLQHNRRLDDGLRQLRLSTDDVNLILAMAMQQAPWESKARATIEDATLQGDLSVKVFGMSGWGRYVNIRVACQAAVTDGQPQVQLEKCRVGWLPMPRALLEGILPPLTSAIREDPDFQAALSAIQRVRVEPDGVELVLHSGQGLTDKTLPSVLARLGGKPDVLSRTRVYYRHLVSTVEQLPPDDLFEAFVQAAFQLAKERSKQEDPLLENRAAILALGILLGHWRVESLVGPVTDRRRLGQARLRDRRDWCQHFFVSAALAVASNESLSDQAGLLKEELDAGEGGSGFSFADLLADRAGTQFALAATRDEPSARRIQSRLAGDFQIGEVFPPADDLPEGIPDPAFQADYGGVGGEKYRAVLAEIERRLETCDATR
jgi:hypothetical protein